MEQIPVDQPKNQASTRILFFDGVCHLCNGLVKFVLKNSKDGSLHFAPLQSESGQAILIKNEFSTSNLDTILYLKSERLYQKSDAILELLFDMGGFWKILYAGKIIPRFVRDFLYEKVANNRYSIFGKNDVCMLPEPGKEYRFIS